MNTSPVNPGLSLSPLKDTPFFHGFHHNPASLSKALSNLRNDNNTNFRPAQQLSMSYFRQTSLSFSFAATYTKVGRLESGGFDGGLPDKVEAFPLDLGGIGDIFNSALDALGLSTNVEKPFKNISSPEDLIKKLIVERLFGKSIDDPSIDIQQLQFYEEQYQKIDFSLDYSGLVKWQGAIFQTEFHLEFHLEQKEMSYIDYTSTGDGLNKLDDKNVDTGRYLIAFESATSLSILDKFSRLSTTVWGDPHVDLSDKEGRCNGEFSDLKKSSVLTTLKLLDKTTVVIKAPDNGLIEEVHIFKGKDHIKGLGRGVSLKEAKDPGQKIKQAKSREHCVTEGTFGQVDNLTKLLEELVPFSDVVQAGGDGNDWFDEDGRLVWGG